MTSLKSQRLHIKNLIKNREKSFVISIVGTSSGVGSTHQSILLANFLRRLGIKVALVECNNSESFSNIEKSVSYKETDKNFKFKGVHYFKNVNREELDFIKKQYFQAVVLDIGKNVKKHRNDFVNSDLAIVITRISEWKINEIETFRDSNPEIIMDRIKWLSLYSNIIEKSEIKKRYGIKTYTLPFIKDAFSKNREIENAITKLFL